MSVAMVSLSLGCPTSSLPVLPYMNQTDLVVEVVRLSPNTSIHGLPWGYPLGFSEIDAAVERGTMNRQDLSVRMVAGDAKPLSGLSQVSWS